MRSTLTMALAVCLLSGVLASAAAAADEKASSKAEKTASDDVAALQGTWRLHNGEAGGFKLTKRLGRLIIKGDEYTITLEKQTSTGKEKLDPTKEPKTIDITNATGADVGKTCLGIYELKGDEFRVAFAPPGKDRPTKFATASDDGNWMHVWKRAKKRAKE